MKHIAPITVRELTESDIPDIQKLASDPAVSDTTRIPHPYPPDGARVFVRDALRRRGEGLEFVYAICEGSVFTGLCGLLLLADEPGRAEIGYWIGRPFWGRGIATAGVDQVIDLAFSRHRLTSIVAYVLDRNPASAKVLLNNGFSETARRPNPGPFHRPDDTIITYRLTISNWRDPRGTVRPRA